MNLTICPTLPTLPMPRVHRCYTQKNTGLSLRKHQNNSKHQKKHQKTHSYHGNHHGKKMEKETQLPATSPSISGWCHCRFGYGFGHWTCQFLGFMATRWSKTWTWWYPRCDGRFEAWHHSWYTWRWSWVNDLGGWGGVGLWGGLGGWCTLKFWLLGWYANLLKWKISSRFCRLERHRQIQPGSTWWFGF